MPEPDRYSPDSSLTPAQHRVLSLLAEGKSIHAAAEEVGVHRNTIRNWRRAVPAFAREAEFAIREQAVAWHEQALLLAPEAIAVIQTTLRSPDTPPALRARTAMVILKMAANPQPKAFPIQGTSIAEFEAACGQRLAAASLPTVPPVVQKEIPERRTIMHNPAPIHRPAEPGRNAACPCGSGQKYKRCCASYAPPKTNTAQAA